MPESNGKKEIIDVVSSHGEVKIEIDGVPNSHHPQNVTILRRTNKNSFILERKNGSESDITSRWVHRESNLMFILSSNKDHTKKFTTAFTFGPCK